MTTDLTCFVWWITALSKWKFCSATTIKICYKGGDTTFVISMHWIIQMKNILTRLQNAPRIAALCIFATETFHNWILLLRLLCPKSALVSVTQSCSWINKLCSSILTAVHTVAFQFHSSLVYLTPLCQLHKLHSMKYDTTRCSRISFRKSKR